MKKLWFALVSCMLVANLLSGAALAKSDNASRGNGGDSKTEKSVQDKDKENTSKDDGQTGEAETDDSANEALDDASSVTTDDAEVELENSVEGSADAAPSDDAGDESAVKDSDMKEKGKSNGGQGYKGLLNAIENVKDKPAGAVLAGLLLEKYDTKLTDKMKAELESIQEEAAALSAAADMLEQEGSVTDAVYMQQEAVRADMKNVNSYKKLGKLYEKLGKTGVKLYVDGEEPAAEVAPFIRDGSTLVPFRAISEALKADVAWNEEERSVTVTRDGRTVKLFIDSKTALVDGQEVALEVAPSIEAGSTVVPVRFVSEALDATVNWEDETQSVIIYEE